jgi:hypothetical protein
MYTSKTPFQHKKTNVKEESNLDIERRREEGEYYLDTLVCISSKHTLAASPPSILCYISV